MAGGAGADFASFVEVSDAAVLRAYADASAPGVVGEVFEFALSAAVEALVAEWLVVTVSAGDAEGAVGVEFACLFEAMRVFDNGTEDGGSYFSDAGNLLE